MPSETLSRWAEMNIAIDAMTADSFKQATACPRCGATGLTPTRQFGRRFLNDDRGQSHKCPDVIAQLNPTCENGHKFCVFWDCGRVNPYDTTGNRVPRWNWRGGVTGDVEPF